MQVRFFGPASFCGDHRILSLIRSEKYTGREVYRTVYAIRLYRVKFFRFFLTKKNGFVTIGIEREFDYAFERKR